MDLFARAEARELLAAVAGQSPFDRRSGDRGDPDALAAHAAHEGARYVVCAPRGSVLFASDTALALLTRDEALALCGEGATETFLGTVDGVPRFAVDAGDRADGDGRLRDARTQAPFLGFAENQLCLAATALTTWHRNSKFCARCGSPARITSGGHCRTCDSCGSMVFPRSDPAAIVAVSNRANDRLLLARSPRHPAGPRPGTGLFTTLAGFVEAGETFEAAVAREVFEETGVRVDEGSVRYLKSQPWPFPQSAMVAFRATADDAQPLALEEEEILEANWFDRAVVRKATTVPGAVMRPDVAAAAFADDPSLELLVPPKNVVARELINAWLAEDEAH